MDPMADQEAVSLLRERRSPVVLRVVDKTRLEGVLRQLAAAGGLDHAGQRRAAAGRVHDDLASMVSPDSVRTPVVCGTPGITSSPVTSPAAGQP